MPLASWEQQFNLTSPYSVSPLLLNADVTNLGRYIVMPSGCELRTTVRSTKEDLSQADGSILHRRFLTGMEMQLQVGLWSTTNAPACDDLRQTMMDEFLAYFRALLRAGDNEGRITWTPDGQSTRMLEDIRLLEYPTEEIGDAGESILTVTIDSQYPYTADENQQSVSLPGTVTNSGNTDTYGVIKLDGPVTYCVVANTTTGAQFVYDYSRPGAVGVTGGNYVEIDMFRQTMYLNGNSTNLKPALDILNSDFFPFEPGANVITVSGGVTGTALVNNAWA